MQRTSVSILLTASALMLASTLLAGCAGEQGEPWLNPGQQERIGDLHQRDEYTAQQLRDRARLSQTQR